MKEKLKREALYVGSETWLVAIPRKNRVKIMRTHRGEYDMTLLADIENGLIGYTEYLCMECSPDFQKEIVSFTEEIYERVFPCCTKCGK